MHDLQSMHSHFKFYSNEYLHVLVFICMLLYVLDNVYVILLACIYISLRVLLINIIIL